jgi:hypothetical protein
MCPDINKEVITSQDMKQEAHVLKLVESGVDITGQSTLAFSHQEPGAIDPVVDNRARDQPASDLPFREADNRPKLVVTIQRVMRDEFQDFEKQHAAASCSAPDDSCVASSWHLRAARALQ